MKERFPIMMTIRASFLLILLAALPAFASSSQTSNLKGAISQLEETSRTLLAFTTIVLLVLGVFLAGIGIAIYFLKLRGARKRETLWVALGFLCGGLGLLLLLGGVLGVLMYIFTPTLIQGLMGQTPG